MQFKKKMRKKILFRLKFESKFEDNFFFPWKMRADETFQKNYKNRSKFSSF